MLRELARNECSKAKKKKPLMKQLDSMNHRKMPPCFSSSKLVALSLIMRMVARVRPYNQAYHEVDDNKSLAKLCYMGLSSPQNEVKG